STYPQADLSMNLINSKGERVAMEELRGKVIFMNIWATWCPPCIAVMLGIKKLYKDIEKDKIAFVTLYVYQDFNKAVTSNNPNVFIPKHSYNLCHRYRRQPRPYSYGNGRL